MWPNWTIPDTSTARTNAWLRRRRCRASLGTLDEKHWVVYNLLQDIGFTMSYHIICNRRIESSNIRLKAIVFTINIWVYPMSGPIWRRCLKKWWENKMRTYLHYIYNTYMHNYMYMIIWYYMCIQCIHMFVLCIICIILDLQCISTNIHGSEFKWGSASNPGMNIRVSIRANQAIKWPLEHGWKRLRTPNLIPTIHPSEMSSWARGREK